MNFLEAGVLNIPFHLDSETSAIRQLLRRYQSVPMSLADACMVRMSELYTDHSVLTIDHDFTIYRKNRDRPIPTIIPSNI